MTVVELDDDEQCLAVAVAPVIWLLFENDFAFTPIFVLLFKLFFLYLLTPVLFRAVFSNC